MKGRCSSATYGGVAYTNAKGALARARTSGEAKAVRTDGEGGPAGGWVTERACGKEGARVNEWARGGEGAERVQEGRTEGRVVSARAIGGESERAGEGERKSARKREREGKRLEAGARIDSRVALYGEVRKLQPEDSSCLLSPPPREKERGEK